MRLKRLKKILSERESFPYLVTDMNNIRYLTGFSGSNATVLIDKNRTYFISDSRYEEYAKSVLPKGFTFVLQEGGAADIIRNCFEKIDGRELFVEAHSVTLAQLEDFKRAMKGVRIRPVADDPVHSLRMVKDPAEIKILREAAAITDRCFSHLLNFIRPGLTEWDVSIEIEAFYKRNGCTSCSFDSIVASGAGSSMPHYFPSMDKKISHGEVLLIDMGCRYKGYNSDLTRTVFVGKIDSSIEEIYHIVYDAHSKSVDSARSGLSAGELDGIARDYITERGFGENFGHGLGHGLGMEIHEMPAVKKNSGISLKKNMVITIEPGIYLPGIGGVRIEDMALVNTGGCELLTCSPRELIVI